MQAAIAHLNPNNKGSEDNIISLLLDKFAKQETNLRLRINMTTEYVYDDERDRENERTHLTRK
jgi:hypothetical protein